MGKHRDKVAAALKWRQENMPKGSGYKKPGSMNPRKTGFRSYTSAEAKRIVGKG
jgi:hypothetical protein